MNTMKISLANEAEDLATSGSTITVELPSGITLHLWVFETANTTSIDVRAHREPGVAMQLDHVINLPSTGELFDAAVVIENRRES